MWDGRWADWDCAVASARRSRGDTRSVDACDAALMVGVPFDASSSPLASAAAWMLDRYVEGELTLEQASDESWVYPVDYPERRIRTFKGFRRPITEVSSYEEVDGVIARVGVVDDRARSMRVLVIQHPDHPGKVWQSAMLLCPPDVTVRAVGPNDAELLRDLELATPVQHEGFGVAYDRPDPFAQDRLRARPTLRCIAETGGQVVGTHADALHSLRTDHGVVPIVYRQQSRVLPTAQGKGVMPAMNGFQAEQFLREGVAREVLGFFARGNDKVREWSGTKTQRGPLWEHPVARYILDTANGEAISDVRPATESDANEICRLLDASNGHCVFWPGPAREWFPTRVTQSPADYSWHDLLMSTHAVVGVWDAGWAVVRSDQHREQRRRVATILDWGFDPDHPNELGRVLSTACARAAARGIDALYAYGGPPAPGCETLEDLSSELELFEVFAGERLAEPHRAATDGVYIDPLYF
jgi:hypothetical protein